MLFNVQIGLLKQSLMEPLRNWKLERLIGIKSEAESLHSLYSLSLMLGSQNTCLAFGKCREVLRLVMRVKVMVVSAAFCVLKSTFGNVRQIMYEVSERMICSHLIPPYSIRPLLIKIKPSSFLLIKILIMEQRAECRRWGESKVELRVRERENKMWVCVYITSLSAPFLLLNNEMTKRRLLKRCY